MYCVFWMYPNQLGHFKARGQSFTDLNEAIKWCEELRQGGEARFVTMAVENPDHVGKIGVSDVLPDDYNWTKRRDATQPLGRKKE